MKISAGRISVRMSLIKELAKLKLGKFRTIIDSDTDVVQTELLIFFYCNIMIPILKIELSNVQRLRLFDL